MKWKKNLSILSKFNLISKEFGVCIQDALNQIQMALHLSGVSIKSLSFNSLVLRKFNSIVNKKFKSKTTMLFPVYDNFAIIFNFYFIFNIYM